MPRVLHFSAFIMYVHATCNMQDGRMVHLCNNYISLSLCPTVAFNVCEHPSLVDCHVNADCVDIVGGYECHCTTGYTGNGTHCFGK